ncbi:MAG: 1,2-phenylacetyl-CoA epoxidase subunit PaaC [Acidimicrobiales bacterium]
MTTLAPGAREYLLAFADDEHLIGQRHTEWIGIGPFLEEDLALTSIAQDELGHAAGLYGLLTDQIDRLALLRPAGEYRSCWLVEQPGTDYAWALARHWLYDTAERHRWEAVADAPVPALTTLARRALREETYHRRHAEAMIRRLLSGTAESHARMADAIRDAVPLAAALFDPVAGEAEAAAEGITSRTSADIADDWWREVAAMLDRHSLEVVRPVVDPSYQNSRARRCEHFAALHADLTEVISIDPTGRW